MSRIGKLPVNIPDGVQVELSNNEVTIKGKLGELKKVFNPLVKVVEKDKQIVVSPTNETKQSISMWGTTRSIISNMVTGVSEGYSIRLEINGVGFKAAVNNGFITLALGFSHDIIYAIPESIEVKAEKPTLLVISGSCKQKVGQLASELIKLRPVEPYKGKGVYIEGTRKRRKEGKKK